MIFFSVKERVERHREGGGNSLERFKRRRSAPLLDPGDVTVIEPAGLFDVIAADSFLLAKLPDSVADKHVWSPFPVQLRTEGSDPGFTNRLLPSNRNAIGRPDARVGFPFSLSGLRPM